MSWKIPLVRSEKWWEYNIQMGLIETGCETQVDITSSESFVTVIRGFGTSSSATTISV
jgi:hypothetical protein